MSPLDRESAAYNLHMVLSLYAGESRSPFPLRRQILMGMIRGLDPEVPHFESEIRAIAARLGTANEQPGDMERVRVIAHRLGDLMCLAVLAQGAKDQQGLGGRRSTPSIPLPAGTEAPFAPA